MTDNAPLTGRFYRHYKGGLYFVHALAEHTEEEGETLVIYRHVSGKIYARPLEIWNMPAIVEDSHGVSNNLYDEKQMSAGAHMQEVPRFVLIPEDFRL